MKAAELERLANFAESITLADGGNAMKTGAAIETLIAERERLLEHVRGSRREHHESDDPWMSCPKADNYKGSFKGQDCTAAPTNIIAPWPR